MSKKKEKDWTPEDDAQLKHLKEQGVLNEEIAKIMGRSLSSVYTRASRKGFKKAFVSDWDDQELTEKKKELLPLRAGIQGKINEYQCIIKLATEGFDLFLPSISNHRTDVLISYENVPIRIQIKSGTYDARHKMYRAGLTTYRREAGVHVHYNSEEIDFFLIKLNCEDIYYVVPFAPHKKTKMLSFSPHREKRAFNSLDNEEYRNNFNQIRQYAIDKKNEENKGE